MALVIEGEERIEAPLQKVWEALNDPAVLKACIPGCQSLEKKSDTELAATVVLKVGPIKATFAGEVTLNNLNPPHSYTITGEGKGGIAGFFSRLWQPGMQAFSTSGSLSASQTFCNGASMRSSPSITKAMKTSRAKQV